MRLIDADALIEEIANMDISEQSKIFSVNMLRTAPTAYDVEKVVAELEEIKQDWKMKEQERGLNFMDCVILREYQKHYDKAIDIVKKGGVK